MKSPSVVLNQVPEWEEKGSAERADCRIFKVYEGDFEHTVSKRRHPFYYIDSRDWVQVVAVTKTGELVFVEQYRFGSKELSLEVPGGVVDPGESPLETGLRELLEETGFQGSDAVELGWVYPNPAVFTNKAYTILVADCERVKEPEWDNTEELANHLIDVEQVKRMLKNNELTHAITRNALEFYFGR